MDRSLWPGVGMAAQASVNSYGLDSSEYRCEHKRQTRDVGRT